MSILRIQLGVILVLALQACSKDMPTPNIVHITADDLGYGELGSFGQKLIKTPHLDQMAADGMRFTQHYAGSSLCNPSRFSYMTGKHAGSTGVTTNGNNILPANTFTVARLMQNTGYHTAIIGKWALGSSKSTGAPLKQGFNYFFGYPNQVSAHNYYPEELVENNQQVHLEGNTTSENAQISDQRTVYAGDLIHNRAMAFLEDNKDQAFYLQLDYNLPHVNNELHEVTGNGFEHPGSGRYAQETWTAAEKSYAEMVSLMDDYIGELIGKLHSLGLAENTLVIFTSDNGPTGVRGRQSLQRFNATSGLRGMKGMLFEGGIRVPMIAWWPGTIEAGSITNDVTTFWDVLPTLADLIGHKPSPKSDGASFAAVLKGQGTMPSERMLYWEINDRKAVRHGDWKWVRHPVGPNSDFLYNIAKDPEEKVNLASISPEMLSQLQAMVGVEATNP
jgi:arylsulfatase A